MLLSFLPGILPAVTETDCTITPNPTTQELRDYPYLSVPLVPTSGTDTQTVRDALALAINAVHAATSGFRTPFETFVANHPDSAWTPAVQAALGSLALEEGRFALARTHFGTSWAEVDSLAGDDARTLGDHVCSAYAQLLGNLGDEVALAALLNAHGSRPFSGDDRKRINTASRTLQIIQTAPSRAFRCGPMALVSAAAAQGVAADDTLIENAAVSANGMALDDLQTLATSLGLSMQMAKRTDPQAAVPTPCVVHWTIGHYAALLDEDNGIFRIADPAFDTLSGMAEAAIDAEASGYFLLPAGALPPGWQSVGQAEGATVIGRAYCGHNSTSYRAARGDTGPCAEKSGGNGDCNGQAAYAFQTMSAGVLVSDTPLRIDTAYGPDLALTIHMSSREAVMAGLDTHGTEFSADWRCNWNAAINTPKHDDYDLHGFNANALLRGGGQEFYDDFVPNPAAPTGPFPQNPLEIIRDEPVGTMEASRPYAARLVIYPEGVWVRELPGGTREVYSHRIADGVGSNWRMLLTHVVDPLGNAATITYDAGASATLPRIDRVTDASGHHFLQFHYDHPAKSAYVTKVTDSLGRQALFEYTTILSSGGIPYSSPFLTKITDAVGIASTFAYDSASGIDIVSMTTPRGTWSFDHEDSSFSGAEWKRSVTVTDPAGDRERIEGIVFSAPGGVVPSSEAVAPSAPGYAVRNADLHRYNSFHWDREAMHAIAEAHGDPDAEPSTAADYAMAVQTHWMRRATTTIDLPASIRHPLEGRTWFLYPGQKANGDTNVFTHSLLSRPKAVLRVVEDENGNPVTALATAGYNDQLQPEAQTDPTGRETAVTYAANGLDPLAVSQRTGAGAGDFAALATFTYHPAGLDAARALPHIATDAAGKSTISTWNARGQLDTLADAEGNVTDMDYEENTASPHFGRLRHVRYQPAGGALRTMRTIEYDPQAGFTGPWKVTDESGHTLEYAYDGLDRVTTVTFPDGTTMDYAYVRASDGAKVIENTGVNDRLGRDTTTTYDHLGRPLAVTDPENRTLTYEWCRCGDLRKLIDPDQKVTEWQRDVAGRVQFKIHPDGQQTAYTYEPLSGRPSTMTDMNGQTATTCYHIDGTVATISHSDPSTPPVSFAYDPWFSRVTSMTDGIGTTSYTYHDAGQNGALRLHTEDGPVVADDSDKVTWTYDDLGRVKTRNIGATGNENLVTYTYDGFGRLDALADPLGAFDYAYVGDSARLDHLLYPNGQRTGYDYFDHTEDHRLKQILHLADASNPASVLSRFDHTYLDDGKIETIERRPGGGLPDDRYTFAYDDSDQLETATLVKQSDGTPLKSFAYGYDDAGNILSVSRAPGTDPPRVTSFAPNSRNQISSVSGPRRQPVQGYTSEPSAVLVNGARADSADTNQFAGGIDAEPGANTVTVLATDMSANANTASRSWTVDLPESQAFSYDANGNLLADGNRTCTWDARNRLVSVSMGIDTWSFEYDGLDRRVRERKNGALTKQWIWCGTSICEERSPNGAVTKRYHAHGEQRLGDWDAGDYFHTTDHLGSVRDVTNASGAVVAKYDYDPYGRRTRIAGATAHTCDFGFTGHHTHAGTGLVLTLYRAYDPETGMWLSPDPIGESVNHHGNLYAYGPNRPFSGYDPLGGSFVDWISGREGWIPDFGGVSTREFVNAAGDAWDDGDIARAAGGGAAAWADGVIPFADPFAANGAYDPCDSDFDFSKGAGKFTRNMWATYGAARGLAALSPSGGTASLAIGRGASTASPVHVAWGSGGAWLHGFGNVGRQRVLSRGAQFFAENSAKLTITGIPVLSVPNLMRSGQAAKSCVTAAASAFGRGWWPF